MNKKQLQVTELKMRCDIDDSKLNEIKKRQPLPTSIPYDPVVASKYKTKRDYWYNEDPVYRRAVRERYNKAYHILKEDKYVYQVTCDRCGNLAFTCEKMKLVNEEQDPFILCSNCKGNNNV